MKGTKLIPSRKCNDTARDIEGWLLRYLTACARMSPTDVSLLEHRICSAVLVSGLEGSYPSITELSATLDVPKAKTSRAVRRMIEDGRLLALPDPDDDRIKRLQHRPEDLKAALECLCPMYDELVTLLGGSATVK